MKLLASAAVLSVCVFTAGSVGRRPESPVRSVPPEVKRFKDLAFQARAAGNVAAMQRHFDDGYNWCRQKGLAKLALRFQIGAAGARHIAGDYRGAALVYLEAEKAARALEEADDMIAIRANLASLYYQCLDYDAAARVARDGLRDAPPNSYARPGLQLILATVLSFQGHSEAAKPLIEEAITSAMLQDTPDLEIAGWQMLGVNRLRSRDLPGAEAAQLQAYRLCRFLRPAELPSVYAQLALLYEEQKRFPDALRMATLALEARPTTTIPLHDVYHLRGRVRRALGDTQGALDDLGSALKLAAAWRADVLPAEGIRLRANVGVQEIYDDYIRLAYNLHAKTGQLRYAVEAWEAAEGNRAASLREALAASSGWRDRLPGQYWSRLATFRQQLVDDIRSPRSSEPALSNDLQSELLKMEMTAGLADTSAPRRVDASFALSPRNPESIPAPVSLIPLQRSLIETGALFTFRLGETESYRWTVTNQTLSLDRLPSRRELSELAARFERAVREENADAPAIGEKLYSRLFGGIPATVQRRPSWFLALDDALFQIPLSALVAETNDGRPVYLIETHSVEVVPGAWAVGSERTPPGTFAGIADPVYNSADPRARSTLSSIAFNAFGAPRVEFSRLPSSRHEIEVCAREYSGPQPLLLSGWDASRKGLQRALRAKPAVLHLATHVVASGQNREEVLILLSGTRAGRVDALTTADILAMRVPGSLVVLSGCGSVKGAVLPGAGLLGLSRAWIAAGARGVIASHWQVPDDSGPLLRQFYQHLRAGEGDITPAEALRRARLDMLKAGGTAARPSYWSAYEYIGRSN